MSGDLGKHHLTHRRNVLLEGEVYRLRQQLRDRLSGHTEGKNMMTNVNHQALKSLSCFAAVTFFSTSQMCTYECFLNTNAMNVLYFLSIVSKPLFFIIMGYMDEVENLTLSNILFKIKAIVIIMLFWYIVPGVIGSDYIQQGYFLQSGTLLGMVGIYLIYPIILKVIRHTHFALVYLLLGMLMV